MPAFVRRIGWLMVTAEEYAVAVIGAGASGLCAAIAAAQSGARTVLLEAQPRMGKKLLATGNGRCNLTNQHADSSHYRGDREQMLPVLREYPPQAILRFFEGLGLRCREEADGRMYPYGLQAAGVLDFLRFRLEQLGVLVRCDFPVEALQEEMGRFQICSAGQTVTARRVVLAAGSPAYPQLGGSDSGRALARQMGHSFVPPHPALAAVHCPPERMRGLKGARSQAAAVLKHKGKRLCAAQGEVQFTEGGLSGICIFDLSRFARPSMEIELDLAPDFTAQQVEALLCRAARLPLPGEDLLEGCVNKLVGRAVVRRAIGKPPADCRKYAPAQLRAAARAAKCFGFPVTGVQSWRGAQVMAGGVPLAEISLPSMESRRRPGLFLCGELLNIDGECGGFNLHWAWSTGLLAGRFAARKEKRL